MQDEVLNDAAQAGNRQHFVEVVHTLKSAAKSIDAFALGGLCKRIETAANESDSAVSFALTDGLSCTFEQTHEMILDHLDGSHLHQI